MRKMKKTAGRRTGASVAPQSLFTLLDDSSRPTFGTRKRRSGAMDAMAPPGNGAARAPRVARPREVEPDAAIARVQSPEKKAPPAPAPEAVPAKASGTVALAPGLTVKDWDAMPDAGVAPASGGDAPPVRPMPAPVSEAGMAERAEPAAEVEPSAPAAAQSVRPMVDAGTFRVREAGTVPADHDLERDIAAINDPRLEHSMTSPREQAVSGFLEALDKSPTLQEALRRAEQGREETLPGGLEHMDIVDDLTSVAYAAGASGDQEEDNALRPEQPPALTSPPPFRALGQEATAGVGLASLGIAIFTTGDALVRSGSLAFKSTPATFRHENTPRDLQARKYTGLFAIKAHHPRILHGTQTFWFSLSFVVNGVDVRDATINLLVDKSSAMTLSSFSIDFVPTELSARSDAVAKIRFKVSGDWNPYSFGHVSFDGQLDIAADSGVILQIKGEKGWVWNDNKFSDDKWENLPVPKKVTAFEDVYFEVGSAKLDDTGIRTIKRRLEGVPANVLTRIKTGAHPVILDGYASRSGKTGLNQDLARDRLDAVEKVVKDFAGTSVKIQRFNHGETATPTKDEQEDQQWRRVHLRVEYFLD